MPPSSNAARMHHCSPPAASIASCSNYRAIDRPESRPNQPSPSARALTKERLQLLRRHSSVIGRRIRLELLATRQRPKHHRLEPGIAHETRGDVKRLLIVARERTTDAVTLTVGLTLQHLEIDGVARFPPARAGKHRGGPAGRSFGMARR